MMMILMTMIALGIALEFLIVSMRRTMMVILMTSLAMAVDFLKVYKRHRRMEILLTKLSLTFLRISKIYTRMTFFVKHTHGNNKI